MSAPVSARVQVALASDQRADAAVVAVLRSLAGVIADNRAGAIAGVDDEHLHQLRIAVRRTRTVARRFAGVFSPIELAGFASELRWLQRATGEARDLDVYVAQLGSLSKLLPRGARGDLAPLSPTL
ncbi:MAG: CHAD domain-containing protein, partial [Solirubrobacteraceae bacterium]